MFLAILVCKLGRFVGKLVGKGSSMPGKFALKICPDILARVQLPENQMDKFMEQREMILATMKTRYSGVLLDLEARNGQ